MSYFTEKLKVEGRLKRIKLALAVIAIAALLGLCIFSVFIPFETWAYHVAKPKISNRAPGEMRLHFLNVGQGDSTIIELPDGKVMLIDGGNGDADTEKSLMRYLNALQVDTIDYLLVTHADSDHCGGLDKVVKYKDVKEAFLPNVEVSVNEEYAELYAALSEAHCQTTFSSRSVILNGEGEHPYALSFLYPYTLDVGEETTQETENNDSSAVVWLDYQGVSTLFTGDAPSEVEKILLRDDSLGIFSKRGVELTSTEILKVAHHGSKNSTGAEFLQYLNVETAVISCGKDNLYGHPTDEVLQRLQAVNAKTFRTDTDGNIMITISNEGVYETEFIA